jgi:hypothetical protein
MEHRRVNQEKVSRHKLESRRHTWLSQVAILQKHRTIPLDNISSRMYQLSMILIEIDTMNLRVLRGQAGSVITSLFAALVMLSKMY